MFFFETERERERERGASEGFWFWVLVGWVFWEGGSWMDALDGGWVLVEVEERGREG